MKPLNAVSGSIVTVSQPVSHALKDVDGVAILHLGRKYIDRNGNDFDATVEFGDAVAASYDPVIHEAKLNPDHNKAGEAWGAIKRVYRQGSTLFADYTRVPADKAEKISANGLWNKRSAEFYMDLEGRGPYLRNVSPLSIHPPAVKSLPDIAPSQIRPAVYAFSEETTEDGAQVIRLSTDDDTTPEGTMSDTVSRAEFEALQKQLAELSEQKEQQTVELQERDGKVDELLESNKKLQKQNEILLSEGQRQAAANRLHNAEKFVEGLGRRVTPGMKEAGLVELLAFMEGDSDGTIELSEGGKASPAKLLRDVLAACIEGPELGEDQTKTIELAEGRSADARDARIKAYAKDKGISYSEAATALKGGYANG